MNDEQYLDIEDDPFITCANCDQRFYDNYVKHCEECEEWFCPDCFADHLKERHGSA